MPTWNSAGHDKLGVSGYGQLPLGPILHKPGVFKVPNSRLSSLGEEYQVAKRGREYQCFGEEYSVE